MKNTISTIYGAFVQACQFFKQPFELVPFTTLNEKYGIMPKIAPAATEMPSVQYVGIGNWGHRNLTTAEGRPYTGSNQHLPSDAGLYGQIPWVVRKLDSDLSTNDRKRYRMRKVQSINGVKYAIYYLRVLDTSLSKPAMTINTKVNGVVSSRPFVPDSSNLSPTPPVLQDGEVLTASGEYLAIKSVVDIIITATEIEDIIEACRILYDNEGLAVISEIALVTGVDRQNSGEGMGNNTIQYTEVIAAQIAAILNTYYSLPAANSQVRETMTLGTSDPMLLNTGLTKQA